MDIQRHYSHLQSLQVFKSSKKKQKLYERYFKNHNPQNLATYETYKYFFETIKKNQIKTTTQKRS